MRLRTFIVCELTRQHITELGHNVVMMDDVLFVTELNRQLYVWFPNKNRKILTLVEMATLDHGDVSHQKAKELIQLIKDGAN